MNGDHSKQMLRDGHDHAENEENNARFTGNQENENFTKQQYL